MVDPDPQPAAASASPPAASPSPPAQPARSSKKRRRAERRAAAAAAEKEARAAGTATLFGLCPRVEALPPAHPRLPRGAAPGASERYYSGLLLRFGSGSANGDSGDGGDGGEAAAAAAMDDGSGGGGGGSGDGGGGGDGGDDMVLNCHPNGLVVLCLAPSHHLTRAAIARVTYANPRSGAGAGEGGKRDAGNAPAPRFNKRRAAAASLPADTVLATVTCADGATVALRACVAGEVMETNDTLAAAPSLLASDPLGRGYIAILRPAPWEIDPLKDRLAALGLLSADGGGDGGGD